MESKNSETPVQIILPFWETVRRSFLYVFRNRETYVKITAVWFSILLYEMFTGFPSLCNISPDGCQGGDWQYKVALILISFASVAVVVAYCRNIILKEELKKFAFSFGKRELKYILFNIIFIGIITITAVFSIFVFAYIGQLLHFPESIFNLTILIPLALTIYFSRFFLIFPAIAVDDKEMTIKNSYRVTLGNANRIFWGQVLMMLPAATLLILLALLHGLINSDNYIINFIFTGFIFAISFLDSCLKASFLSHIYQYFTYFQKNPDQLAKVETTSSQEEK